MRSVLPLLLLCLCATAASAHPFDDRADMVAEIILVRGKDDSEQMKLQVQYRYESIYASYNEAVLELDDNRDQHIDRTELDARFKELALDIQKAALLTVRDEAASIEPDFKNFAFANLDNPDDSVDSGKGVPVTNLRIGYFFYFDVKPASAWGAGKHPVQFLLASRRITVSDPSDQLRAWDDRGERRKAINSVTHDKTRESYDRLNFMWEIEKNSETVTPPPIEPPPDDDGDQNSDGAEATGPDGQKELLETDAERHDEDSFDSWIDQAFRDLRDENADFLVWFVVLGGMFLLGGYHALQPGHGKTLVASYLIGTQGTKTDALFLGVVVTAAHTSGVLLLMGGAWAASEFWPGVLENPEKQLAEWITLAVGATIFLMGFGLVMKRTGSGAAHAHDIFGRHVHPEDDSSTGSGQAHNHGHHHHDHAHPHTHAHDHKHPEDSDILEEVHHHHEHDHTHGHSHSHTHDGHTHHHDELDPSKMTRWEILRLGILGGVVPCPSAFVIGLIAFQQQWYLSGLIMVIVFSLGLAAVLATIGLVLVTTKSYLNQKRKETKSKLYRFLEAKLPVFGALVITLIGTVMVVMAMIRLELIDPSKFTV